MSLNVSQLRERVAALFTDIQQVDDSIIRFTKKTEGKPFAVYYLDFAEDLPVTQEKLTKYQDRVIGRYYFEDRKSLQWSNYLYFVTSGDRLAKSEVRQAKELIERDRSYARKFVISEAELDSILAPLKIAPVDATPHASILSIWTDRLTEAGIDRAILSDDSLPDRLKLIEASSTKPMSRAKPPMQNLAVKAAPFIHSLELKKYLDFPVRRHFEFSTVNLIVGANGSGKTSLLEAIELFYCGRNKRNPNASLAYTLAAKLADGQSEIVADNRALSVLRDRNLMWYGQSEVKTNNLYQSFAQFNFLDTDAAVSLADSTSQMEDDLSKLLVGPDASKVWRNIERVCEAVSLELRGLRTSKAEMKDELAALTNQLKAASGIQHESDSIRARLEEMIKRVGWRVAEGDKETFAGRLVESLSELVSIVQQSSAHNWTESPVSLDGLAKYCRAAKAASEKAELDIARLEVLRRNQKHFLDAMKRDREASDLAEQAKRLIDAGVPIRETERNKQQKIISTYSGWLAGLNEDTFGLLSTADLDMSVVALHAAAVSKRSSADTVLKSKQSDYANFSKLRDQSLNLAQELRQVAAKILQSSPKPDECPLCHTRFESGALAKHINVGVDTHLEALGQAHLIQLREQENIMRSASAIESASAWLNKFCERASLASDVSVRSALSEVENAKQTLSMAQLHFDTLNSEVLALASQGLSMARLEEISTRLREVGYSLAEFSQETAERLLSTIELDYASSSLTLETESKQADELQQAIEATLGAPESGTQSLKGALSQLKERLAGTESLLSKLSGFSSSFPWFGGRPLAELVVEVESVRNVAVELQSSLGKERQADDSYTDSIKRKEIIEPKLEKLSQRVERLNNAHTVLLSLQNNHSLESAMKSALQQNRVGIEEIFSRIHSPAEFRGLGSNWNTLVRQDGTESNLSQISTGQRAAFALSIFLSQNAQLTVAPPVVLIDDPIAHIDDLNSLSFLDYLRDLVLTRQRQIFFATASDRLATLFERKFDFLGAEGFRRFDLRRETPLVVSSE